ncbi:ATP/GTP-binding protein [gut metagenome]|uniref:ATP/GTP-binding protein n=1 Tax=gut metagenome TaxID=749906 RepID=J9GCU2_9ZZZZ
MIVDLKKQGSQYRFKTEEIESIEEQGDQYLVQFYGKSLIYKPKKSTYLFLHDPEKVELEGKVLYCRGIRMDHATEAYRFSNGEKTYWYIVFRKKEAPFAEEAPCTNGTTATASTTEADSDCHPDFPIETGAETAMTEEIDPAADTVPETALPPTATSLEETVLHDPDTIKYTYKGYAYADNQVYFSRTSLDQLHPHVWSYILHAAEEVGQANEQGKVFLAQQLKDIDLNREDSPLTHYLNPAKSFLTYPLPSSIYYPFGCNQSQQKAVEAALTHQFSIIQGPPGTGKTQTILNLIANLHLAGKKVLVVSNNNSAVDNIYEKLSSDEFRLDFLVARLGNNDTKEAFCLNQTQHDYPADLAEWLVEEEKALAERVNFLVKQTARNFANQTRLAQIKVALHDLLTEQQYYLQHDGPVTAPSDKPAQPEHPSRSACPDSTNHPETASLYPWLYQQSSDALLRLLLHYSQQRETGTIPSWLFRLKWLLQYGWKSYSFLRQKTEEAIPALRAAYYTVRSQELTTEKSALEQTLAETHSQEMLKQLVQQSQRYWKHQVAQSRLRRKTRAHFNDPIDIKKRTREFLAEYPIVLSTTQSSRNCINNRFVYDYVIIDEASQVDIISGLLALSCARNAVVVGDEKQLPNIVKNEHRRALQDIEAQNEIPSAYCTSQKSFLSSCMELFRDVPQTLLREHYRCHPRIIEFCNQHFYNGQLIAMTSDHGEPDVLRAIRMKPMGHERIVCNPREVEVIRREILPRLAVTVTDEPACQSTPAARIDLDNRHSLLLPDSLGFITPYKEQAKVINETFHTDRCSTVHKFQGRECDSIVMSMVANDYNAFIDDPELLNVAVSRAKSHFALVLTGNELPPQSNLMQLIDYIRYQNFEVGESKLNNVFDLLYKPYTEQRLAYERSHPHRISEHLSECLVYDLLEKVLPEIPEYIHWGIVCHYPLSLLVKKNADTTPVERDFIDSPYSHVDFLVYNTVTKKPYFCMEVDGCSFHRNPSQEQRDQLKNFILSSNGIRLLRISTDELLDEVVLHRKIAKEGNI